MFLLRKLRFPFKQQILNKDLSFLMIINPMRDTSFRKFNKIFDFVIIKKYLRKETWIFTIVNYSSVCYCFPLYKYLLWEVVWLITHKSNKQTAISKTSSLPRTFRLSKLETKYLLSILIKKYIAFLDLLFYNLVKIYIIELSIYFTLLFWKTPHI